MKKVLLNKLSYISSIITQHLTRNLKPIQFRKGLSLPDEFIPIYYLSPLCETF